MSTQPVFLNGVLQVGAIVNVYDAGTLTPRTAYKDGLATIPWLQAPTGGTPPPNCLQTDASGCIPVFFIQGAPYRVRITAASGVQIRDVDQIAGDSTVGTGGGVVAKLPTGMFFFMHTTQTFPGIYVRANGLTIGTAVSGATERANGTDHTNGDCFPLYFFLWPDTNLPVSGGRGANAAADFDGNKTLTLPDYKARALFGIDGMGGAATGRLANALFATGNAATLGSTGGEGAHIMTLAETVSHGHTGTVQPNTAFSLSGTTGAISAGTPAGTLDAQGVHSHTGVTSFQTAHVHAGSISDSTGAHTHLADTIPAHTHTYGAASGFSATGNAGSTFTGIWNLGFAPSSQTTDAGGGHTPTIQIAGTHQHTLTLAADGGHNHTISADGSHAHTFTGTLMATHAHTFTTATTGSVHTHAFISDLSGGGAAHNNMPPFGLATCFMAL